MARKYIEQINALENIKTAYEACSSTVQAGEHCLIRTEG